MNRFIFYAVFLAFAWFYEPSATSASSVTLPNKVPIYTPSHHERLKATYHGDHSVSQLFADGDAEVLEVLEAIPDFLRWKPSIQEETPEALELLKERLIAFWPPFIKEVKESQFEHYNCPKLEVALDRWIAQHHLMHDSIVLVLDEEKPSMLSAHIEVLYSRLRRLLILRQDVRVMVLGKSLSVQRNDQDDEDRL